MYKEGSIENKQQQKENNLSSSEKYNQRIMGFLSTKIDQETLNNPDCQANIEFVKESLFEISKLYPDYDLTRFDHIFSLASSNKHTPQEVEKVVIEEESKRELYNEYINPELTNKGLEFISSMEESMNADLGQERLKPFKLVVIDVASNEISEYASEFKSKLAQIKGLEEDEMRLNPHVEKHNNGEVLLVLFKEDIEFMVNPKNSDRQKQKKLSMIKHELYHTQRDISEGYNGLFFEELAAEQVSGNTQGYKGIKFIWKAVGEMFGFDQKDFLGKALKSEKPLEYVRENLPKYIDKPLTQLLISYLPNRYAKHAQVNSYLAEDYSNDISKDLLYFAEKKLGSDLVGRYIQKEAEYIKDYSQRQDMFNQDDLTNMRYRSSMNFGEFTLDELYQRVDQQIKQNE